MANKDLELGFIMGISANGDKSEAHRVAVVAALQSIVGDKPLYGGIINAATWPIIDSTIRMIYASGLKIQVADYVTLLAVLPSEYLDIHLDDLVISTNTEYVILSTVSLVDSVSVTLT